nr:unnamed protein product [Callosobruchus analis]
MRHLVFILDLVSNEKKSSVSIEGISTVLKGSRCTSDGISVNSAFGLTSGLFQVALAFTSGFLIVLSFSLAPSFFFVFAVFGDCFSFFSRLTATSVFGCRLLVIISSAYLRFISRQAAVLGVTTGLNNVSSQFSWMTVSSPITPSWSLSSSECTFTTVPKGFTTLATAGFICTITQRPPGQKEPMAGYFDFFYAGYVLCEKLSYFLQNKEISVLPCCVLWVVEDEVVLYAHTPEIKCCPTTQQQQPWATEKESPEARDANKATKGVG